MTAAYYNEHDPFAVAWLEELIKAEAIMDGVVDTRSIEDVLPSELQGFTRCHFFAGIGGWDYALQLAGWPDDQPIWTGSCPCQPFSAAGQGAGFADERHLWPSWFHLIRECRPSVLVGEQVEAAIRHGWLDLVHDDLEGEGYAVGVVGLPAASVGAPHIRQRMWFVADRDGARCRTRGPSETGDGRDTPREQPTEFCATDRVENPRRQREHTLLRRHKASSRRRPSDSLEIGGGGTSDKLGHAIHPRPQGHGRPLDVNGATGRENPERHSATTGVWDDGLLWLPCSDGKTRPAQSGILPLAHGVPNRVGTLRGAGNAIVPQVGAEVIRAYMDVR